MKPYDPLEYANLARSVVDGLLNGPINPLPPTETFAGSGVYAIYYRGDFEGYTPLVKADPCPPIYVGKAVPSGARKGGTQAISSGRALHQRLREHSRSIQQAENLCLDHFVCRYLVVVPVWIGLAERFLIEHYQPIWNVAIDGFGNHAPGAGRRDMRRPLWDILHPGRPWAAELKAELSFEDVLAKLNVSFEEKT